MNYVSVTEQNTQKAYLYDEKGNLLKDFPVESISPIAIDVDYDKSIWVVTEKSTTELILYTMKQFANEQINYLYFDNCDNSENSENSSCLTVIP